jgi:predicted aspartyl protease
MRNAKENAVGRFKVEVEIANNDDVVDARRGRLDPEKVRRLKIQGVVDSGASRLVLPQKAVKDLGLETSGKVRVRYADGRSARRPRVQGVYLKLLERDGVFTATVEPKRDTALIGAIVLEDLDFVVDCTAGRLYPRDPDYVVSEAE